MEIVANSIVLKILSTIDIFQRDLGQNLSGKVPENGKGSEIKIKISDEFIKKYYSISGDIIYRYGTIGKIKFYQDPKIKDNEIQIHLSPELIYEVEFEIDKLRQNPRGYFSELLENLEKAQQDDEVQNENYKAVHMYSSVPNDIEKPKINLNEDQYIDEMITRRRKMDSLDLNNSEVQEFISKRRKRNMEKFGF